MRYVEWDIAGASVLVTGGTSGIGRATADRLARLGADVTITSRSRASAEAAATELSAATGASVGAAELDLSSLAAVRGFVSDHLERHDRLDVLVNNAGTITASRATTVDGFETIFAVNHLGPFLLTNLLLPTLVASAPARIVNVSSENHRAAKQGLDLGDLQMQSGWSPSRAYAASKLANILFAAELDRRFGGDGITARALHPGVVATGFGSGPDGPRWMRVAMRVLRPFLATPEKGAATSVLIATAPDEQLDGLYWSSGQAEEPSAQALDPEAARRLWEVSAELVGLAG
jgi:NAD(P)-dependent dehydrogenase (short-subunit alcohol dehydrogenase family)